MPPGRSPFIAADLPFGGVSAPFSDPLLLGAA
jgi:hypothetical protein